MDAAERYNSLSKGCAERQTHRISYLEIPALPEPRVGQTILACGSEAQGNVLGAVPHSQFYFRPNTLETQWKRKLSGYHRWNFFFCRMFCFSLFSCCFQS